MQTPLDAKGWRQHIWRNTAVNGATNAVANGLICWLLSRNKPSLELFSPSGGISADLLATGFLLAMIVTLILIPIQRRQLTKDALSPEVLAAPSPLTLRLVAVTERYTMAVAISAILGLIAAAATLLALNTLAQDSFTPFGYSVFKGLWAGIFAGALAYLIIYLTGHRAYETS